MSQYYHAICTVFKTDVSSDVWEPNLYRFTSLAPVLAISPDVAFCPVLLT
jgi:hypothetical protein